MQTPKILSLLENPAPELYKSQLDLFTPQSMRVKPTLQFDVVKAVDSLKQQEGKQVVASDFGGDKGTSKLFVVKNGKLVPQEGFADSIQGDNGRGYMASITRAAEFAEQHKLSFGISWGGPMEGARPAYHPKAMEFLDDLDKRYGGDLKSVSPSVRSVLNDGPAGLISGSVEAHRRFKADTVLFVINGGGIGLSILKDSTIYATEAGHVEGVAELNIYNQNEACGVFGAEYTCVERLGANKAGIEAQWQAKTGSYMRARDIEDEYKAGDRFAAELYDHSALVLAHVITGSAKAMGIDLTSPHTAIVAHGGAFKFPNYGQRIRQIIENNTAATVTLLMTNDFSNTHSNACLDGAAIAALTA